MSPAERISEYTGEEHPRYLADFLCLRTPEGNRVEYILEPLTMRGRRFAADWETGAYDLLLTEHEIVPCLDAVFDSGLRVI